MTLEDIQALPLQGIAEFHLMYLYNEWHVSAKHHSDGQIIEMKAKGLDLPEALASVAAKLAKLTRQGVIGPANQIEHRASPDTGASCGKHLDDLPF